MDFLNNLTPASAVSAVEVVANLILAFILGIAVTIVYRLTNRNRALNYSLIMTMIILAMVVALVMMVIGNSVARAFSLVGALSIIRFRTVVKDNRDIAYVFFALGAGMAAGVGNYEIALFGVGIILVLLLILDFVSFGTATRDLFLLRLQTIPTDMSESLFMPVFAEIFRSHNRLSTKTVKMGQYVEYSFLVRLKPGVTDEQAINRLTMIEGMARVSMIAESNEAEA
ncbi:DUF4956 domain-containing protein [bacterium]|nr:DUF4956 domain-containing protein [bacterium]MBU1637154.1 DUF4956 domain-containing protein [bacterium]RQV97883.1 MAG: DUF4956 domain-containing protein [bacterium]